MKQSIFFVDYQNGSEMHKWYQVLVQDLDVNVDENLVWLTQKTEDPKKWQPPPISTSTPLSSKKMCTPQVTQFLEGPTPTPNYEENPTQVFSCETCRIFKNTLSLQNTSSGSSCISDITNNIWVSVKHLIFK